MSAATAGFGKQFPASLPRLHRGLDPEIVLRLLSGNSAFAETPESEDMGRRCQILFREHR